jgi:hypothetical protein
VYHDISCFLLIIQNGNNFLCLPYSQPFIVVNRNLRWVKCIRSSENSVEHLRDTTWTYSWENWQQAYVVWHVSRVLVTSLTCSLDFEFRYVIYCMKVDKHSMYLMVLKIVLNVKSISFKWLLEFLNCRKVCTVVTFRKVHIQEHSVVFGNECVKM